MSLSEGGSSAEAAGAGGHGWAAAHLRGVLDGRPSSGHRAPSIVADAAVALAEWHSLGPVRDRLRRRVTGRRRIRVGGGLGLAIRQRRRRPAIVRLVPTIVREVAVEGGRRAAAAVAAVVVVLLCVCRATLGGMRRLASAVETTGAEVTRPLGQLAVARLGVRPHRQVRMQVVEVAARSLLVRGRLRVRAPLHGRLGGRRSAHRIQLPRGPLAPQRGLPLCLERSGALHLLLSLRRPVGRCPRVLHRRHHNAGRCGEPRVVREVPSDDARNRAALEQPSRRWLQLEAVHR